MGISKLFAAIHLEILLPISVISCAINLDHSPLVVAVAVHI